MSFLLTDPDTVLVVGGTAADRRNVDSAVTRGSAARSISAPDVDAAVDVVAGRDDVGCVVLLEGDVADAFDALDRTTPRRGVVVFTADDADVAAAVAEREGWRYLPRSTDVERLRVVVDDALASYERRRRRAAESSLFTTLLDDGAINVYAKDDTGRYLYIADYGPGPDPADTVGLTTQELFPDEMADIARRSHRDDLDVVESGEPIYDRVEHYDADGDFWVETSKIPWEWDGEVRGLVGVTLNVSERERLRRELERERKRVERFVTYVSHDLRTPLQIAIGALERAKAGDDDGFAKLEDAHDRIHDVVADLATLATDDSLPADAGRVETRTGIPETKFVPLVESAWESLDTDGARLDVAVPELTTVVARRQLLRPVVENLLENAVVHGAGAAGGAGGAGPPNPGEEPAGRGATDDSGAPDGEPDAVASDTRHGDDDATGTQTAADDTEAVTVRVGTTDDRPGFYVADDGPGIPEDERDRVTAEGYTTAELGTGTGLSIVSQTADQRDWNLSIAESETGGARVEVTDCHVVPEPAPGTPVDEPIELTDSVDVGSPRQAGRSTYETSTDEWTVAGGGFDLWARTNQFHYRYAQADGPVRIQGRVESIDGVDDYSKAGLMVRDGLDGDAAQAYVGTTSGYGTEVIWRSSRDDPTRTNQFEEPGEMDWFRVDFAAGQATCSVSLDGKEWQPVGQFEIDATGAVAVGLVVCSHSDEALAEATFADVTVRRLDAGE